MDVQSKQIKRIAFHLIVFLGVISLFADIATTGARSIIGPYFDSLGANAMIVAIVAGFGELVSNSLRFFSGYLADRLKANWSFVIVGYLINLAAIPLLAVAWTWEMAAAFIIVERTGKAIRTPSRDAILSYASQKVGRGWGFGIHKMLDQFGAMFGPILVAILLFYHYSYKMSFVILFIPAAIGLVVLIIARILYKHPKDLESSYVDGFSSEGIKPAFWYYLVGISCVAAGYADFPLMAFHFENARVMPLVWIPLLYALALGVSAVTSLLLGYLFDKNGTFVLITVVLCSSLFAPLTFLGNFNLAVIGMMLWGIGMGTQISLTRAIIAKVVPKQKRGFGYGIFNAIYGVAWFLGSVLMGLLYNISLEQLVIFSMIAQLISIPVFIAARRKS